MTQTMQLATGNGYEADRSFDGYVILAAPLCNGNAEGRADHKDGRFGAAARESRVFYRQSGAHECGTDYGSHVIRLATRPEHLPYHGGRQLYLLVEHGAGTEVWFLPSFYDGGDFERALLAMPERLQYAALYTLYTVAHDSRNEGARAEHSRMGKLFLNGKLKKRRKGGRAYLWEDSMTPIGQAPEAR